MLLILIQNHKLHKTTLSNYVGLDASYWSIQKYHHCHALFLWVLLSPVASTGIGSPSTLFTIAFTICLLLPLLPTTFVLSWLLHSLLCLNSQSPLQVTYLTHVLTSLQYFMHRLLYLH